jgi:hypothetical protein
VGRLTIGGAVELFEIFLKLDQVDAVRIRDLEEAAARDRRARRIVAQGQDEQIAALAEEHRQLRLWLAALTEVLVGKGLLTGRELRDAAERLCPPAPVPDEDSPFAGLDR